MLYIHEYLILLAVPICTVLSIYIAIKIHNHIMYSDDNTEEQ